ncbi:hypothetical protein AALO_G00134260 [Alosa alosa]|uniref:Uncharacterized protein n=1 Tax=Alosa alosa TaxID=278164 RepID=A0AAV6GGP3_9TELE|nr:hypothetical protein AALO_G00134260 [Alosa alosa]
MNTRGGHEGESQKNGHLGLWLCLFQACGRTSEWTDQQTRVPRQDLPPATPLTVSDLHLDDPNGSSTPRPHQELPQLIRHHQYQEHVSPRMAPVPTRRARLSLGEREEEERLPHHATEAEIEGSGNRGRKKSLVEAGKK